MFAFGTKACIGKKTFGAVDEPGKSRARCSPVRAAPSSGPRTGFLVWNEFQFFHISGVLRLWPDAILVVEKRFGFGRRFPFVVTRGLANPIWRCSPAEIGVLADRLDRLVVQSNTPASRQLPREKVVALQYSMSKEWHQYGPWMTEAGLVLCYGPYSRARIRTDAPVVEVGNPRLDPIIEDGLDRIRLARIAARLDPRKKTLMLAPSWNDGRTVTALKWAVPQLSRDFNVLWCPHHNTKLFNQSISDWFWRNFCNYDYFLYALKLCDVLVSDTSGALLDAVQIGRPVVIADLIPERVPDPEREASIEFARRTDLGPVAASVREIGMHAGEICAGRSSFREANEALRRACFPAEGPAAERVRRAIVSHFHGS